VTEYLLTDAAAIGTGLELSDEEAREYDRTYYDTVDGLLHAAGASLAFADGRLSCGEASLELAAAPERVLAFSLPPGPLREALEPLIEIRAALPVARVRSRVRTHAVLDEQRKTVVRILVEEPSLVTASGRGVPLRGRVRLAPVRGYGEALARVDRGLAERFEVAAQSVADEAARAAGAKPEGVSSKVAVELSYKQRADAAAAAVLLRLLEVIEQNFEGTIADVDAEFLHDLRVATRRTRSVQRELKRVFPPHELARFRAEFRWLQQATGDARDLDVYVLEFDSMRALVPESMRDDLEPLLGVLRNRRLTARREMVRALRSDRCARLLTEWRELLERLPSLPLDERPFATRPIGEVSGERIRKVYRRMVKMGDAIDESSPPDHYHELRKKGKELRYLLELFGGVHPSEVVKPMIKTLKALQDVLGRHQDREVQVATLRGLRDEVSSLPGGAAALMAMGVLVMRLGEDERAARDEFAKRFDAFSARQQRKLVKKAFS
jgi:CHAD domain-containing protein